MMTPLKWLIFSVVGLLLSGMLVAQKNERITMIFQENVCMPEWFSFGNDGQTHTNLKATLTKDSISVYSFKITGKPYEVTCAGCQCLTGRNIEVTIDPQHRLKLEEYHFHRPWVWMDKNELTCDWTMGLNDDEIADSLMSKGIRVQGVYGIGLSQNNDLCSLKSGRILTLRVDKDDMDKARAEGFVLNEHFKQY